MYIGYATYYLTRRSFTYAMPAIQRSLSLDVVSLGLISTVFSLSYGVSKFFSGIIGDRVNPRYFLPIGLILTGLCNVAFGSASTIGVLAIFWGLNGWFQGFGWPSCARLLTYWYSQSERGTWWGRWNTSHNVGGAAVYLLVAQCLHSWSWSSAFYLSGCLSIVIGFVLMERLRDTPQSLGLPPVEEFREDQSGAKQVLETRDLSTRERLGKYVVNNPYIWLLAISYFFLYIARTAINDWSGIYLANKKDYSTTLANAGVFIFEIGGIFGGLSAGWISDRCFGGRRALVSCMYAFGVIPLLALLGYLQSKGAGVDLALMGCIGFLIFGPQMLIGVAAAELSHKQSAAAATGFIGCFAYLGAAIAGYPLGMIIQHRGWMTYYGVLLLCCLCSALALLPLWNAKHYRSK